MSKYEIWIDDERLPKRPNMLWVRTIQDFDAALREWGCPSYISFDHDLGHRIPEGYDLAKLLVEFEIRGIIEIPLDFKYDVHSANPIGKKNIQMYLNSFLEKKRMGI